MSSTHKSNTEFWNEIESACPDEPVLHFNGLKDAVHSLFIPYNVSYIKFIVNFQYLTDVEGNPLLPLLITPSCSLWDNSLNRPKGYETWFFAGFPDVADWAAEKTNQHYIEKIIHNIPKDELDEDYGGIRRIKTSILKKIIQAYIDVTHKQLETVYSRDDAQIMERKISQITESLNL